MLVQGGKGVVGVLNNVITKYAPPAAHRTSYGQRRVWSAPPARGAQQLPGHVRRLEQAGVRLVTAAGPLLPRHAPAVAHGVLAFAHGYQQCRHVVLV